ncbi:hypothetical protein [Streptomyces sp. NPDC093568]|uniref:hypothetical protein n=1 Tax=Streptomyces sp. NPDC093568 TaxID=3366041 RepID=UPI003812C1BA
MIEEPDPKWQAGCWHRPEQRQVFVDRLLVTLVHLRLGLPHAAAPVNQPGQYVPKSIAPKVVGSTFDTRPGAVGPTALGFVVRPGYGTAMGSVTYRRPAVADAR